MNKSKFLKKSLAMLLALMLVVAMIPLSASAAETGYFKDLYVNGKRVEKVGNDLSVSVLGDSTEVDITGAALNGATLYVDGPKEDLPLPQMGVDLTEYEEVGEGEYELTILAKKKLTPDTSDYETVESYTLTVTVEEVPADNDNTSLRGLAKDDPAWDHMVSYTVEDEGEGAGTVTVTLKFGYDKPGVGSEEKYTRDSFDAVAPDAKITLDGDRVKVTSAQGSTRLYDVEFVWEAAFESFTIPEQIGETEFVYEGRTGNKININVPYGYDLKSVIPTFALADGIDNLNIKDNANGNPPVVSDYTVLTDVELSKSNGSVRENVGTEVFNVNQHDGVWSDITLTITAVAQNDEALLKDIIVKESGKDNISNKTDATVGTTYVEMPKGTGIYNNNFDLTMTVSRDATVVVTDANNKKVKVTADTAGTTYTAKNVLTGGENKSLSFTVVVTSEDGTDQNNYNIVLSAAETALAKLENITLKDTVNNKTYDAEINQANGEVVITVPYFWTNSDNTEGFEVYVKASTGATVYHSDKKSTWTVNTGKDFNDCVTYDWLPKVDGVSTTTLWVDDNDPLDGGNPADDDDFNKYTVTIKYEDPKQDRVIEDIQFVGTDKPYEITEDNTYPTEIGTATLDGKTVRTIEVTVPYSFVDYTDKNGYISELEMSEGAVAYGDWSTKGAFNTIGETSTTNYPWAFNLGNLVGGKAADGTLVDGKYFRIFVLSEEYAVPEGDAISADWMDYKNESFEDNKNMSVYYLVVNRAAPETGHSLLSIESTVDPNVTATLKGDTVTITVPASYVAGGVAGVTSPTDFSLNFETSKLAKVYTDKNCTKEVKSDLGSALTDATKFLVEKQGNEYVLIAKNEWNEAEQLHVRSEDKNNTTAYDVKVVVGKPQTGAEITNVSVNGVAGTIARDKITVRLPLGTQLYPVTLDITASKMASIFVNDTNNYEADKLLPYEPDGRYDVNEPVTINVKSEDGATLNTYTLTCVLETGFEDVNTGDWFYGEVMTAANAGWVNGMEPGKFEPNGTMTRAQFATIVARILGCDTDATVESMFPDCNETDWFNAAVTFCVKRGIIAGDDKGYFNPNEPITREQMAKILCEAAGVEQVTDPENTYADDASIAGWAKGYVYGCQAAGIMHGDESANVFDAKDSATRAEGAAVLVRAFA
ncbi:MAG TPA: S-layer homology domain-containing protein [Candidatus Acutalibacter pullistercoris]|uniref:S-layer homology domain-containing protein n=1 Tax=Candidatus Acutalibacter pullistercoris TaxID=2838418 RepID=A0A9D1YET0_9FIRM|nr:S-layer homology domain-containing protein [Candidatus Acutalibacter pullistercoris]